MTVGSFTVTDADAVDGTGCTDINLNNNSSSVEGYRSFYNDDRPNPVDPGTSIFLHHNWPGSSFAFEAFLADGSSMVTGLVANSGGYYSGGETALAAPQPSGNYPCINMGGIAGT